MLYKVERLNWDYMSSSNHVTDCVCVCDSQQYVSRRTKVRKHQVTDLRDHISQTGTEGQREDGVCVCVRVW